MANANFIVRNGISVGGASGASITADPATGAVVIAPAPTAAVPNPTAVVFTTTGTVQTVATTSGVASAASVLTANTASASSVINGTSNVTVNTSNVTIGVGGTTIATFSSTGDVQAQNLVIGGNLTVQGTTTTVNTEVATGSFLPSANNTYNLGSALAVWATVYGTTFSGVSTTAKYADLAENYQADRAYAPGTVVMFGGDQEVTMADAATTRVAGVVSTNPAHLMNGGLTGQNVVPLALQGRVPCNIIGPVKKGDMMVSAGHGYAVASANPQVGQVIGKALYDYPGHSKAVIEVVVGRV